MLETKNGPQLIYPVLLAGRGDLQTQYPICRMKNGNYAAMPRGCNNCDIAGSKLDCFDKTDLLHFQDYDGLMKQAIKSVIDQTDDVKDNLAKLNEMSLYCIPVKHFDTLDCLTFLEWI